MSWQNTGNSENIYHIVCRIVQQLMHVIPFLKRVKIFESYCSFKFGLISALFYDFSMFPLIPFFGFWNRNWRFCVDLVLTVEDLVTIKVWMIIWKLGTPFFISNTFISKARLISVKNQAKAKQDPEAELFLFENYSLSSSTLPSKNKKRYSRKCTKNKCVCFNEVIWSMTMKTRMKNKSRSHKYNIERPRPRNGRKCTKYKIYVNLMMVICIKRHLSNIWSSIHKKVKQNWYWVEKKRCL